MADAQKRRLASMAAAAVEGVVEPFLYMLIYSLLRNSGPVKQNHWN
jgi:hypothetical protein